jgi:oligoribonuclease (3'-5' exoribonuclease)
MLIIKRIDKGEPLTHLEMDDNFGNIASDVDKKAYITDVSASSEFETNARIAAINAEVLARNKAIADAVLVETNARATAVNSAIALLRDSVSSDGDTFAKLRVLITGLATLVSSNDPALNTVQEIIDRIKADELLINAKINTVDIVNVLTSISITKPLSAAQGKALKDALDTETANRIAAGNSSSSSTNTTITNAIATEVSDRNAAISVETAARIAADALKTDIAAIVNVLTSTVTNAPLSAAQGKVLKDLLDLEVTNRINAVSAEVTARNSAVSVVTNGLSAETNNRISADADEVVARNNAIAVETANRTTADNTEIAARNTAIATAVSNLKSTVPADGDTLAKLRNLIAGLQTLVASDDINLDTIQELVSRIKSDEGLITSLTTNKINITDIINVLTSTAIDKPLSAAQGKVLKDLIDLEITNRTSAVNAEATARANADALKIDKSAISNILTNATTTDVLSAAQGKALKDALDLEVTNRINADSTEVTARNTAIANAVATETTNRTTADTTETNARIAADTAEVTNRNNAISSAISSEVTNRDAAIAVEATNRTNADNAEITARITAITTAINNLKAGVASDGDTLAKLRTLIAGLQALLTSNDVNLDTIQEFVDRIKSDEGLITSLTTNKVNVSDIVNLLTSSAIDKPLSAAQGKILKDALDAETAARVAAVSSGSSNAVAKIGDVMSGPLETPVLRLNRQANVASGISYYNSAYNAWCEYMANAGVAGQGPRGALTPIAGSLVTAWAKRSFIENGTGYGWVFEVGAPGATAPAIVMELDINGNAKYLGNVSAATLTALGNMVAANVVLPNAGYVYGKSASNVSTRMLGINAVNEMYFGAIDTPVGNIYFLNGTRLMTLTPSGALSAVGSIDAPVHITSGIKFDKALIASLTNADAVANKRLLFTLGAGIYNGKVIVMTSRSTNDATGENQAIIEFDITRSGNATGPFAFFTVNKCENNNIGVTVAYQWYFDSTTGNAYLRFGQNGNSYTYDVFTTLVGDQSHSLVLDSGTIPSGVVVDPQYTLTNASSKNTFAILLANIERLRLSAAGDLTVNSYTGSGSGLTGIAPSLTAGGANLLNGFSASQLSAVQSTRDFPLGTLISTSIDYSVTNGTAWFMEIKGNAYQNALPFDISVQGYIYSDTILSLTGISNGKTITGMVALNVGGKLCFWFPTQQYWQGFTVMVTDVIPAGVPVNKVVSIGNTTKPVGTKEVAVVITQSWHSGNLDPQAATTADTTETNARIAADAAEVTARNTAITSAITALKSGVATDGDTLAKLRTLISGLQTLMTSDDVNLDTIQEFVTRIKSDEGLITSLTTNKINVTDIVNLLTSTASDKPLSAAQGKILKDALDTEVSNRTTLSLNRLSDIGNAVNLNIYVDQGIRYQVSDAQAATGSNYPIPYAGKLEITVATANFIWQKYTGYNGTGTREFNRQFYNGGWSAWRELQYTDSVIANATNAVNVTGVVPIANGGTGAATQAAAQTALGLVPNYGVAPTTVVMRDANGDAFSRFVNTTDIVIGTGVTGVVVKAGDNFHRTANRAGLLTFLALTSTDIVSALGYTPSSGTPSFAPGGVIEGGRYLDFHGTNSGTDFDVRLDAGAGTGVNGAGTLTIAASGGMSVNGPMGATVFNGPLAGNASTASSAASLSGPASVNGTDGWFRSTGTAGWFNSTYNVGIYSNRAGEVRTYNGANFVSEGTVWGTGGKIGRVRTDTIEWGSYGSISINGNTNGWGGIAFPDSALTLMMNNGLHGVFINNSGWLWQCDSAGNFTATANVTAYSDERLKENWRDLQINFVELWAGVKHGTYDKKKVSLLSPTQTYTGLSAQSVREILPHTVLADKEGILSLNYGAAAAVASVQLAKRVVEQDLKIQSLETLCSELLERLIKLENK